MANIARTIFKSKTVIVAILSTIVICNFAYMYSKNYVSFEEFSKTIKRLDVTSKGNSTVVPMIKVVNLEKGAPFLIPNDDTLRKLSEKELLTMYWKYINSVQVLCRNQTRVGILKDGGKEMCIDEVYKPRKPCIVYSFGSNFQFDFDVPMHNFYGCDVLTYDPSMNIAGKKLPAEIKFELRGLAGKDFVNERKWKMSTLKQIFTDNHHENSVIDILKIDIEGGEWEALPPAIEAGLLKRVKQILIEVHAGRQGPRMEKGFWGGVDLPGQLRVLRMLYEAGFRIFMREHNMYSVTNFQVPPQNQITIVNEISLINVQYSAPPS